MLIDDDSTIKFTRDGRLLYSNFHLDKSLNVRIQNPSSGTCTEIRGAPSHHHSTMEIIDLLPTLSSEWDVQNHPSLIQASF